MCASVGATTCGATCPSSNQRRRAPQCLHLQSCSALSSASSRCPVTSRAVTVTAGARMRMPMTSDRPMPQLKVEKYVSHALRTAGKQTAPGESKCVQRVRTALQSAQLRSTLSRSSKDCATDDTPDVSGHCWEVWASLACNSGPYLVSAGFEELSTTDISFSNAIFGDVAVWPALTVSGHSYPGGYIAIKTSSGWVSDSVHDVFVFGKNLKDVALHGVPKLYRLTEAATQDVEIEEELSVAPCVAESVVDSADAWCAAWSAYDIRVNDLMESLIQSYKCPATMNFSSASGIPREFDPAEDVMGYRCVTAVSMTAVTGVRCCYFVSSGLYLPSFPSQVEVGVSPFDPFQSSIARSAEKICCRPNQLSSVSCMLYRSRRPSPNATNGAAVPRPASCDIALNCSGHASNVTSSTTERCNCTCLSGFVGDACAAVRHRIRRLPPVPSRAMQCGCQLQRARRVGNWGCDGGVHMHVPCWLRQRDGMQFLQLGIRRVPKMPRSRVHCQFLV